MIISKFLSETCCFAIFEVRSDGNADVRSAYKKKALVHHPDRNGGVQSDEFLRLKQAYDVLIDGDKRRNYDAFHHTGEFKRDGRPLTAGPGRSGRLGRWWHWRHRFWASSRPAQSWGHCDRQQPFPVAPRAAER